MKYFEDNNVFDIVKHGTSHHGQDENKRFTPWTSVSRDSDLLHMLAFILAQGYVYYSRHKASGDTSGTRTFYVR